MWGAGPVHGFMLPFFDVFAAGHCKVDRLVQVGGDFALDARAGQQPVQCLLFGHRHRLIKEEYLWLAGAFA